MVGGHFNRLSFSYLLQFIILLIFSMKKLFSLLIILLVVGTLIYLTTRNTEPAVQGVENTTGSRVLQRLPRAEFAQKIEQDGVVILDVRSPEEFVDGHIAKALNMDYDFPGFKQQLNELDKNASYLVYCRSGNRSGKAVKLMQQLGFSSVFELEGGINVWQAAGYPLCTNC